MDQVVGQSRIGRLEGLKYNNQSENGTIIYITLFHSVIRYLVLLIL